MKHTNWVGLVAALAFPLLSGYGQTPEAAVPGAPAQAQAGVPADLSPGASEVVRLAGSGLGDDVVLAYIQNSQAPFQLSTDDVLYLKDLGLSPQVTAAMLSHDSLMRSPPQQYVPAAPTPATPPRVAPAPVAPPPAYVSSPPADVSYFYNDLSPYGTWVSMEGYGWCWQPRTVVISRGWRPYCDGGHWVYTDAGWYWQSDYSWGWAPFHYGRWYLHPRSGWIWLPDRVWGPAWVTWRVAGNTCGWAPLPPRAEFDLRLGWRFNGVSVGANFDFGLGMNVFAFVALGDFCSHDLGHRCLPPARVAAIYRQTTIINNYAVNNRAFVNRGIPVERVAAVSRVPVPRATIHDLPAGSVGMPSRTGAVVYRTPLKAPARSVNMVAQKVDTQHPVIQHAPIVPVRTEQPSAFSRSGSASVAAPRRSTAEAPNVPAGSSSAKPASSSHSQSTSKTYRPASTRTTDDWKQGAYSAPGYRSDTGLAAAYAKSHPAAQSSSAAAQTPAMGRNTPAYYPKGYHQAAEVKSLPPADEGQSAAPSSTGRNADSKSGKNQ